MLLSVFLASWQGAATPPPAEPSGPPKRVAYSEPQYPARAREVMPILQGIIMLELHLAEDGRPAEIRVLRGIPLLDEAAVKAARTWRYEPSLVNGVATRVVVEEL